MSASQLANLSLASKSKKKKKVVVKVGMVGDSQIGKCWGRGTLMTMMDGTTKTVEQIREGDQLLGDDGTPRTVQPGSVRVGNTRDDAAIPSQSHASMYRIVSHDPARTPWTCNGDHILVLKFDQIPTPVCINHAGASFERFEMQNGVVARVQHSFESFAAAQEAYAEFAAISQPLVWECSIDMFRTTDAVVQQAATMYQPDSISFTPSKFNLQNRLEKLLGSSVSEPQVHQAAWSIGMSLIAAQPCNAAEPLLQSYGLTEKKYIPPDLLRDSIAVRRHLLAGAIDSSAQVKDSSSLQVVCVDRELMDGLVRVARSIGLTTGTIEESPTKEFSVSFNGTQLASLPITLQRSVDIPSDSNDSLQSNFTISPIGHDEYFGFTLDGNGRCLLGDFTVTHNTSLMVKYVEGNFNEDYIQTLGVNFMEKTIALRNTDITFSIWDLGGQQEYLHMLPLVCNDAVALLFMFDLSRKSTLTSVKNWFKQARLLNKTATPFLIGTKYDYFSSLKPEEKKEMTTQARRFAKAMKAPLIFCSASHAINIHKIFKVVLAKVFDLKCTVQQITNIGDPIIEYEQSATATDDGGAGGDGPSSTAPASGTTGTEETETGTTDDASATPAAGGVSSASAAAAHRKNNSSVSSTTSSTGSGPSALPAARGHQSTASIGSNAE